MKADVNLGSILKNEQDICESKIWESAVHALEKQSQ